MAVRKEATINLVLSLSRSKLLHDRLVWLNSMSREHSKFYLYGPSCFCSDVETSTAKLYNDLLIKRKRLFTVGVNHHTLHMNWDRIEKAASIHWATLAPSWRCYFEELTKRENESWKRKEPHSKRDSNDNQQNAGALYIVETIVWWAGLRPGLE